MLRIIAADIGGTHSRFAGFTGQEGGEITLIETCWLKTAESPSFGDLVSRLRSSGFPLLPEEADIVVIAVAGPVEKGVYSSPPFISWDIDISSCRDNFGFKRCLLINDFIAQAHACRAKPGREARRIMEGEIAEDGATAVIGAGTGLGKAVLYPLGKADYIATPSEGGHASFPFAPGREQEFQEFLLQRNGNSYVTGNDVLSGRGLGAIHRFLTGEDLMPKEVTARLTADSETLVWAARFYGRACRDFALETLALGGIYIAGGLAARTPALVTHEEFAREFRSSSTMSSILAGMPVFLMSDQESGLWGAALCGQRSVRAA